MFDGQELVGKKPNETAAMGLARTFQEMKLWRHMTVLEHIKMARYSKFSYGLRAPFSIPPNAAVRRVMRHRWPMST